MVFITWDNFHCFSQSSQLTENNERRNHSKIPRNTSSVPGYFQFLYWTYESYKLLYYRKSITTMYYNL